MIKQLTILSFIILSWTILQAQVDMKNAYRIEGSSIVLILDNSWTRVDQEKLLDQCGMKGLSLDTLWRLESLGRWAKDGWKLSKISAGKYKVYKLLSTLSGNMKYKDVVLSNDALEKLRNQTTATYGSNSFKKQSITQLSDGKIRFFLAARLDAKEVILSGTFNGWSTLAPSMIKKDSGWIVDMALKPGKHCYKFIVNGRWVSDPENNLREDDYHGGFNSVYFATNKEFTLNGYPDAKRVIISGSFNSWNERELRMQKTKNGWKLPVYLKDGIHSYKFIVDSKWITDPSNPIVRDDGTGNKNSYICLGDTLYFNLNGFLKAKQVIVAGDFNSWNKHELVMARTNKGWQLPYVLAPGNYQYKFLVDGQWATDPLNPHAKKDGDHTNSVIAIKSNFKFKLKGSLNAKEVQVAGNFNGWTGYTMKKTEDGWFIDVYLTPGKCLYKFIVDGEWIIDPGNQLWEQNEYGTGNSVLWVGAQ